MTFVIGQCWISEGEPELGVGFVRAQDALSVAVEFPSAAQARLYRKKTAPLRRLEFRMGDTIQTASGRKVLVDKIETIDGLIHYSGVPEAELAPTLRLQRPLERFQSGQWDSLPIFELRRKTLDLWHRLLRSPTRGLLGPRTLLLPHQLFVVDQVSSRSAPRALLADEVGLGKTIEAGWIAHRLIVTGRARRVLVLAPAALVNQWFIELFRRFNLSFWVPDSQSEEALQKEDFADQERVILSIESLKRLGAEGTFDSSNWDLVIVDEAHRVAADSAEYAILETLSAKTNGLLLLTATPEQLGLEGHFARLKLLDPARFRSYANFLKEYERYQSVAKKANRLPADQARALVDLYGTGRVYFRNAREVVELEHAAFPKRALKPHLLESKTADGIVAWLADFVRSHKKEKALLICSQASKVIDWEKRLREEHGLKVVAFHEKLPLLARDRNAAYFEDPDGANLLLCSEIGGEGRNFQHASHLILADLPTDPDVLEQRIGRLDRIGQASDITIHVPYVDGSRDDLLMRWYRDVFNAFEKPAKGASRIYDESKDDLEAALEKNKIDALIKKYRPKYQEIAESIDTGRDRLIELNSFDPAEGIRLSKEIEAAESPKELRAFLEGILDSLEIHTDELDADTIFAEPGDSAYVSYFPALPPEGLRMTFSRKRALARNDLSLMTWDHPMAAETIEAMVSQELGNMTLVGWKKPTLLLECTFILADPSQILPPELIRVAMDVSGNEVSQEWTWEKLRPEVQPLNPETDKLARRIPPEKIRGIARKALGFADKHATVLKARAAKILGARIDAELARLEALSSRETDGWKQRKTDLARAVEQTKLRLDSVLLVIPQATP